MRLFVNQNNTKVYLNIQASSRAELAQIIGSYWFTLNGYTHHVSEVRAESDSANTAGGAAIGGLVGLLGGPLGLLVGGAIGGMIGNASDGSDKERVSAFNSSYS